MLLNLNFVAVNQKFLDHNYFLFSTFTFESLYSGHYFNDKKFYFQNVIY